MSNNSQSPPSFSLTPSIGTSRRSRAGTLPSNFLNTNTNHNLVPGYGLSSSTSPLMSANSDNLSLSNEINISTSPDFLSSQRIRSGSLFSSTSIWNDDEHHSPVSNSQAFTDFDVNRNRSFTSVGYSNFSVPTSIANIATQPAVNIPNVDNGFNSVSSRHRAQTYSGIPDFKFQSYNTYQQPVLVDDVEIFKSILSNSFENPSLGPTKYLLFDNVPNFFTSGKLFNLLRSQGIISIKTYTGSNNKSSLVECLSVDFAMSIKATFNHYEIIPGFTLYIAFASLDTPPVSGNIPGHFSNSGVVNIPGAPENDIMAPQSTNYPGSILSGSAPGPIPIPVPSNSNMAIIQPTNLVQIKFELISYIKLFSNVVDINKVLSLIDKSINYPNTKYQDNFGSLPEPIAVRQFDASKLRELRKCLEGMEQNGQYGNQEQMSQEELDEICIAMIDELPELSYDYLGNTIVQKIFHLLQSPLTKLMMVKQIAPYLTQLSIHKNGTWAIQKIINVCSSDKDSLQQKHLIGTSLKPYTVKLLNDQFGNYVIQGCIKFGSPYNDFIIESVLDNFLEISFGRFGSRSIRTILETSNYLTNEQVLLISGLIVEYCNELIVNPNGSLLITWFLDSFQPSARVDKRYELLTNKLLLNLPQLCIHKLANLMILKILSNRVDLGAKTAIMERIFGKFNNATSSPTDALELILTESIDNYAGPLFIHKILTNPLILSDENPEYQKFIMQQVRRLLLEINITNYQPYRKLMDEVGLSTNRLNRSNSRKRSNRPNINPAIKDNGMNGINGVNGYQYPYPQVMNEYYNKYHDNRGGIEDNSLEQLEKLSLNTVAMGYNSNPGTPSDANKTNFFS